MKHTQNSKIKKNRQYTVVYVVLVGCMCAGWLVEVFCVLNFTQRASNIEPKKGGDLNYGATFGISNTKKKKKFKLFLYFFNFCFVKTKIFL